MLRIDGDIILFPVWIEAYYANKEAGFMDPNVDAVKKSGKDYQLKSNSGQVNHFGEPYFHRMRKDDHLDGDYYRQRVDIVLSKGKNYALSFLIKAAIDPSKKEGERYLSQSEAANRLKKYEKDGKKIELDVKKPSILKERVITIKRFSSGLSKTIENFAIKGIKNTKTLDKLEFMSKYNFGFFLIQEK